MTVVLDSLAITIAWSGQEQEVQRKRCRHKGQLSHPTRALPDMKAIRRSIKGEKQDTRPLHNSITPKSAIAIQAPKRVIKALYDYNPDPQNTQELGFAKGDFFHVISRENDPNWYEACNPLIPSARGLVPVSYFENIGKTERQSGGSTASHGSNAIQSPDSGYGENIKHGRQESVGNTQKAGHRRMPSMGRGNGAMVYGIVQYDFNAERPDELEAKQGEAIIVIAQSNPEWFVAKPIGRLGGPGLIPVSFIEIRDMSTGQAVPDAQAAVARAGVPKVEEWKKMAADYKNSSITLGKFEATNAGSIQKDMERMSLNNGSQQYGHMNGNAYMQNQGGHGHHQRQSSRNTQNGHYQQPQRRLLAPVSASIPRYIFENDKYWYIIECEMEDGSHWELSRIYQKFYDFQIALLQQFQRESITPPGGKRLLPFMPGPVTYVTDAISNGRRENLNQYLHELLALPHYISRCELVRELFAPREGDHELDPDRVTEDYRHSNGSQRSSFTGSLSRTASRQSSRGQMNGVNGYGAMGPPQHKVAHQRSQGSANGATHSQQYRHQPDYQYQNAIKPQSSTITQASSNSSAPNNSSTNVNSSGALKIKVHFQDDLIAIRVPSEISFQQLKDKLIDRLKVQDDIIIQYKDESTNDYVDMFSDRDLDMALSRNQKLTLYVGYAE
ncbi:bud emergence protein 1 [Lecanora helva]